MDDALVFQVIDLAYGDCGKGTIVDFLVRQCPDADLSTVVRFNGGPQAAHNVISPDGKHHTFSQIGSGGLAGAATFVTRDVLVEPYALLREAEHLRSLGTTDPLGFWYAHPQCRVITPAHQAANRLRALSAGVEDAGTCGVGVGELMRDHVDRANDLIFLKSLDRADVVRSCLQRTVRRKQRELQHVFERFADHPLGRQAVATLSQPGWIEAAVDNYRDCASAIPSLPEMDWELLFEEPQTLIMEGAQGVLLDEHHGFHPHTTWSTTTFDNADEFLRDIHQSRKPVRLGVLRSYFTRHGAGPFVTEDASMRATLPEPHNSNEGWQGAFRIGSFDAVAARYALDTAGGVDALAVTHCDRIAALSPRICVAYDLPHQPGDEELFVRKGDVVSGIRTHRSPDLDRQSRLTQRLKVCRPVYADAPTASTDAYLARLSALLGVPIAIASFGPKAADKDLRINLFAGDSEAW